MGMFDDFKVKNVTLPRLEGEDIDLESLLYQTKDFECRLWLVTLDGEKLSIRTEKTHIEKNDKSFFGISMVVDSVEEVDCADYGDMYFNFYTSLGDAYKIKKWIEFKAHYKDGKVIEIKRVLKPEYESV